MNESDRNRLAVDILAAEYVLGVTQGAARTQLARLIATDPILRDMTGRWERLLAPLVELSPDVRPSLSVWNNIQRATIEHMSPPPVSTRAPQGESAPKTSGIPIRLAFWRSIAAINFMLAAGCATTLIYLHPVEAPLPPPREPDIGQKLAVLVDRQRVASWLMRTDGNGKRLTINPLRGLLPLDEQNYVLWLILDRDQAPINLGVLPDFGRVIDPLPDNFAKASQIGITLEQAGDGAKIQSPFLPDMVYLGAIVALEARFP